MQLNQTPQYTDVDEETWPQFELKTFTPLLLMHFKGQRNLKQANTMVKLAFTGKIDDIPFMANDQLIPTQYCNQYYSHKSLKEVFDKSTVTKDIAGILALLEKRCFVLVEGPPGIGKSVLLKELLYTMANKQWMETHKLAQLLKTYKLVLLYCLRDPMVQEAKSIDDLLQLYCIGDKKAPEIVSASSDQLFDNGGENLLLLLDGFDELPEDLQKNSLIAKILKRKSLPHCGLVLSSRPHASGKFREKATFIVEILGFTEESRIHFIEQALQEKPQKVKELLQYLDDHSHINTLCFVPFNMAALVFLDKEGIPFPKNSTDMYSNFICLTICRHLAKSGYPLTNTITDLTNLPKPYNEIIEQLSTLSLQALNKHKLVFTLDEIKAVCPDIEAIPGAKNGFGLLQAVQHNGFTGKISTFNFIHFSIQEYLAAHCIMKLPPLKELQLLQQKFWSDNYLNTFAFYVALTKGQKPSFKEFLSDGNETINISEKFLSDMYFCFHLYHCYYEAGDKNMCESIAKAKIFNDKSIYVYIGSSYTYLEYLTLFLTSSFHKTWDKLTFGYIQDYGIHIICKGLKSSNITITELWLSDNGLTSSSAMLVSHIAISCRVKRLILDYNETIGENDQLYSMFSHPSTTLEVLSIYQTNLSSRAANILFITLQQNNTLKILSIEGNDITDDTCPFIANAIKSNSCLVKLWMHSNPISAKAIELILQALQYNNTLESLRLPNYSDDVIAKFNIEFIEEKMNQIRENYGSRVKLLITFRINGDALY